jgi:hypothetical protein
MIWLREADVDCSAGSAASLRLGGITVYGRSLEQLTCAIELGATAICATAKKHFLIARSPLRHMAAQQFAPLREPRLFQALIGPCLTRGDLDTLVCAGQAGGQFWTVFHSDRAYELDRALEFVLHRVSDRGEIGIGEVRDKFFPKREKGTWYSAQSLLCRAATLGLVVQRDKYVFDLSEGLRNALSHSGLEVAAFRVGRLDFG